MAVHDRIRLTDGLAAFATDHQALSYDESQVADSQAHKEDQRPRLPRTDLRINRLLGIVVLAVGAIYVYSTVFTDFDQTVPHQWETNDQGERVPVTHITCPSPWSVMFADAQPQGVVTGDICLRPSRGNLVQGAFAAIVAVAVALWALTRVKGLRPIPLLPSSLQRLLRNR